MIPVDYEDITNDVTTRGSLLSNAIRQHIGVSRSLDWASPEFQALRDEILWFLGSNAIRQHPLTLRMSLNQGSSGK